ncbi:MAG: hypothetical protein K1X55_08790 [Chitinophagales bacterium]|nr:hypothetical protein [Chitinophagales bacterium]
MEDKQLNNPQEGMQVILSMIENSKADLRGHSFLFLTWGFLTIFASLIQYICIKLDFPYGHYAWLLMIVGAIITVVDVSKRSKSRKAKSFVDKAMQAIWIPFGIGMIFLIVVGNRFGFQVSFPIFMLIYGMGTFATGKVLDFKPLIYGSLVAFCCAFISLFIQGSELLLMLSVSLLFSYVIPGFILKRQSNGAVK